MSRILNSQNSEVSYHTLNSVLQLEFSHPKETTFEEILSHDFFQVRASEIP